MTTRRNFLKTAPIAAMGVTGLVLDAKAAVVPGLVEEVTKFSHTFPNAVVVTHTGQKLRFYDDLVKDKVVMINFMSIENEVNYPITERLAKVADLLGDKLGRDVFMVSITRDPAKDSINRLKDFAAKYGLREGWSFIRPDISALGALEERVYHHESHAPGQSSNNAINSPTSRKVDIVFYGNGRAGLWGTFPVDILAEDAVRRISWVMPTPMPTGELHRAGPRQLSGRGHSSDNRQA